MYYLHTSITSIWVFLLALMIGYVAQAVLAYRRRQRGLTRLWILAAAGTYVSVTIIVAMDRLLDEATSGKDVLVPAWPTLMTGIMIVPPCACFVKAAFAYEWLRRTGWLTMSSAAWVVYAQSCVYLFNSDEWREVRGLSQVLFFASGAVFMVMFIVDLRERRRFDKKASMSDERCSY